MRHKARSKLFIYFTFIVFGTILISFCSLVAVLNLLFQYHFIPTNPQQLRMPIIMFLICSILIGSVITYCVGHLIIRPVENMSNAFKELETGNFSVQISNNEKLPEVKVMIKNFNTMVNELSHRETIQSDFVVNVSHEFKTPIAAIEGYAILLQEKNISEEEVSRYLEKILANAHQLANLSSNILTLSKLENQEVILNKKEFRLDEQIRQTILLLENKWMEKEIEFNLNLNHEIYYGNESLLQLVWFNLIENSIKYSANNSLITISLLSQDQEIIFQITDQGIGISKESQKYIFDKFYQADASRKSEGNGLGLSLVNRIIQLCKGSISVSSEINQGTTFKVILPKDI